MAKLKSSTSAQDAPSSVIAPDALFESKTIPLNELKQDVRHIEKIVKFWSFHYKDDPAHATQWVQVNRKRCRSIILSLENEMLCLPAGIERDKLAFRLRKVYRRMEEINQAVGVPKVPEFKYTHSMKKYLYILNNPNHTKGKRRSRKKRQKQNQSKSSEDVILSLKGTPAASISTTKNISSKKATLTASISATKNISPSKVIPAASISATMIKSSRKITSAASIPATGILNPRKATSPARNISQGKVREPEVITLDDDSDDEDNELIGTASTSNLQLKPASISPNVNSLRKPPAKMNAPRNSTLSSPTKRASIGYWTNIKN